jgi:hypothetical protein
VREEGAATELVKRGKWGTDDDLRRRACTCRGRSGVAIARVREGMHVHSLVMYDGATG